MGGIAAIPDADFMGARLWIRKLCQKKGPADLLEHRCTHLRAALLLSRRRLAPTPHPPHINMNKVGLRIISDAAASEAERGAMEICK